MVERSTRYRHWDAFQRNLRLQPDRLRDSTICDSLAFFLSPHRWIYLWGALSLPRPNLTTSQYWRTNLPRFSVARVDLMFVRVSG